MRRKIEVPFVEKRSAKTQCKGKRAYRWPGRAVKEAKKARKRSGRETINAYRCPHCMFWHIGGDRGREYAKEG